jgi:hypothetical protein
MIAVPNPIPEPADFDATCRQQGNAWLLAKRHAGESPKTSQYPNYWSNYEDHLARAFQQRCGWWAMWIAEGQVEHFLSKKNRPDLTYEWSNYRFIAGSVNGSKGNHDNKVLDPFEIQDGWFEVILPSMQLVTTSQLPAALSVRAEFTLKQLRLRDGTKVMRNRKRWYQQFKDGALTMDGLKSNAPLLAAAVTKLQAAGHNRPPSAALWTSKRAGSTETPGRVSSPQVSSRKSWVLRSSRNDSNEREPIQASIFGLM